MLPYCATLEHELASQTYAGEPIRVRIDNRDIRGGEKKWQWVKRGVPLRVEIGPRDVAGGKVFVWPPRCRPASSNRRGPSSLRTLPKTLDEIQHGTACNGR